VTTPTTVQVQIQLRADTAANWTSANPTLLANELGLESDTKKIKIGNGTTAWNSLAYFPFVVSGGTVLGNLEIGTTGTLTFEGSTANGFETTLAVTDPTADRTITLPNQSGTVIVSGNASIVNADISASAEIAVSKLADGAARQLLQTDAAGTGVEWASNIDVPGTLDVTGAATFDGSVTITGDLTVNGMTTNINTQNLVVEDKNVILGDVATPTDVTADGGGITLKGATDKTINWVDATDAWTLSEHVNIASGKEYRINGTKVLDATSLGSSIALTASNLSGAIPSGVLGNSTTYVGTTSVALNRSSANQALTGISSVALPGATSGTITVTPASVAGTTAITVPATSGTLVTTGDSGTVTSTMIADGTIVNGDISASAAIAGTKISPDFGAQNTITTGTSTAASFIPTSSTVPTNGVYLPAANSVALATNGTQRLSIDSNGNVEVAGTGKRFLGDFSNATHANRLAIQTSTTDGATTPFILPNGSNTTAGIVAANASDPTNSGYIRLRATSTTADITSDRLGTGSYLPLFLSTAGSTDIVFQTNNTERLRITSDGKVGVGTSSPQYLLDVRSSGTQSIRVGTTDTSGGTIGQFYATYQGGGGGTASSAYLRAGDGYAFVATGHNVPLLLGVNDSEKARLDSSGCLLVGTSSSIGGSAIGSGKLECSGGNIYQHSLIANQFSYGFSFVKSRSTTAIGTILSSGDQLGPLSWYGDDGTSTPKLAANIDAFVDGTPGANDMPGRIVLSVTADGASSPTEALRITNDRVVCYNQPDVTSKSAGATLTIAELKTGIIQYTGAAATLTLPTGTLSEGGFSGIYTNMTFEWSVINTGSGTCTIGAGTGHTIVGGATIAAGASGRFASRRTAANTFVSYRLS
jgi:hypothetical protein